MKRYLALDNDMWPHVYYRDDQLSGTRFVASRPHLVSSDSKRLIFYSAYKELYNLKLSLEVDFSFLVSTIERSNIGLIHCNGGSLSACDG